MNNLVEGIYFLDSFIDPRSDLALQTLCNIKQPITFEDGNMTIQMVADYFEVGYKTLQKSIQRNQEELNMNGLVVLEGEELRQYKNSILYKYNFQNISKIRSLTIINIRLLPIIATLLKESRIAQQIRNNLGIEYIPRKELIFKDLLLQMIDEVYNNDSRLELICQNSINNKYRIDFYFPRINLAIEYDEYDHIYKQEQDLERQQYIEQYGITFIRVKQNEEISGIFQIINYINNQL